MKNILCFQYDDQFVVAQIFEGKNKWRMNILYSSEIILEESKIFQAIKLWASDKGINFLWHISNLKNTRKNIFSKLLKKTMNFAYYTSNKELSNQLSYGIDNIQAGDSDSGHLILF